MSDWWDDIGCDTIDFDDVMACEKCGRYSHQWQDGTGEWRCWHCDPKPTKGRDIQYRSAAIRERMAETVECPKCKELCAAIWMKWNRICRKCTRQRMEAELRAKLERERSGDVD